MRRTVSERWAIVLLALLVPLLGRTARAQPCLTCRNESCPTKATLSDWCGRGKDPLGVNPSSSSGGKTVSGVQILSEPTGAQVRDGLTELGQTPLLHVKLARGSHLITYSLPGYQDVVLQADVQHNGQILRVAMRVQDVSESEKPVQQIVQVAPPPPPLPPMSPPPPPPPPPRRPFYKKAWFWGTLGGVVAAGIVIGVVVATYPHYPDPVMPYVKPDWQPIN